MTDHNDDLPEERLRALTFTYEATDENAEIFAVVMGSVAENFRFIELHEVMDETVFADPDDRAGVDQLYAALTADGRLSADQRRQVEEFGEALRNWGGDVE